MNALAPLKSADHTVEWQINPTHILLLLLLLYVVTQTDVLTGLGDDTDTAAALKDDD